MAKKYYSYQRNELPTKKQYKELSEMLTEWLRLYDEGDSLFISKQNAHKYKIICKYLKVSFKNDTNLKECIKSLPNILILKSWFVEIMLVLCFVSLGLINAYFLHIYTGVLIPTRRRSGGETDFINVILFVLFVCIYLILFHKRIKMYSNLRHNILEISDIVKKKV